MLCRLANVKLSAAEIQDKLQEHASPGCEQLDFRAFLRLCCSLAERLVPGVNGALAILRKRPLQRSPTDVQRLSRHDPETAVTQTASRAFAGKCKARHKNQGTI